MDPRPRSGKLALRAVAALAFALAAGGSWATLYKWTDANGRIVYSDQAPGGGVKYEVVSGAAPPDNPNAAREMANRDAEMKKAQRERADEAKKAEKSRTDAAKRADICTQARAAVKMYQDENEALVTTNDKGERVAVEPAERQRRLAEQQRLAKDYCAG